ncbi:hypothetical protein A2239_00315 [Candidatus Uhrbacteria bacterium RIFOXYA2_FULL_40_9]|nr:MAG: hypothetical protein UT94_C0034G0023 [Candidatus Uhrbacteria bacterium GW2011_GWF2_40_263]OGL93862.1 MAG: hypothetical protein A2239_00315 [Candidatus Uhrbacteria bacterium RIFOXYA2_FULL_40_9]OGL97571.1 MAG: hypothetical protein A2332_03490 [Candidatus Uhrbacteria bacterium RIFOXYB2_FULL_41_18]HBK34888.1 hypothetical protein [Candidatus Uhrbacteria bacterium]HCB56094.1 hypothetical protein [Candidatus Uhrbacteria bacterium]
MRKSPRQRAELFRENDECILCVGLTHLSFRLEKCSPLFTNDPYIRSQRIGEKVRMILIDLSGKKNVLYLGKPFENPLVLERDITLARSHTFVFEEKGQSIRIYVSMEIEQRAAVLTVKCEQSINFPHSLATNDFLLSPPIHCSCPHPSLSC